MHHDSQMRLGFHVSIAQQALVAVKTAVLKPFDLTIAQYFALVALYYVPGQSSTQLARLQDVTPQTIGSTLDKLEAKGLITREPSKLHRKVLVINLTPEGEALLFQADEAARSVEDAVGQAFSPKERAQFADLLARFTEEMRSQLPAEY